MSNFTNQLRNEILKEMRKAMQVASKQAEADMFEQTYDFYTQGEPSYYVRTGALGDTPRVTTISRSGNQMNFDAYLDTNHVYGTGCNPTMSDVLHVANRHSDNPAELIWPLGKEGFWDRAEKAIGDSFEDAMENFFEKG
jgi:hypothetical protein